MRKLQSILIIIVISIAFLCGNINLNLVFSGTLDDIENAMNLAEEFLDRAYHEVNSTHAVCKDYPSLPFRVFDKTHSYWVPLSKEWADVQSIARFYGGCKIEHIKYGHAFVSGDNNERYYKWESDGDKDYNDLILWCEDSTLNEDHRYVWVHVVVERAEYDYDIYIGDQLIIQSAREGDSWTGWKLYGWFSQRYPLRHATRLMQWYYEDRYYDEGYYGWYSRSQKLKNTMNGIGYNHEFYAPLWGKSNTYDDVFPSLDQYPDYQLVDKWIWNDQAIPYQSHLSTWTALNAWYYVLVPHGNALYDLVKAVHLMYKYGEQKLSEAKDLIDYALQGWDGYGIKFYKDRLIPYTFHFSSYDAYTTATVAIACAKYYDMTGDTYYKTIAREAIGVILQLQLKLDKTIYVEDHGYIYRPDSIGGFLMTYTFDETFHYKSKTHGWITQLGIDLLSKLGQCTYDLDEYQCAILTNTETTILCWKALWYAKKYGLTPIYKETIDQYNEKFVSWSCATGGPDLWPYVKTYQNGFIEMKLWGTSGSWAIATLHYEFYPEYTKNNIIFGGIIWAYSQTYQGGYNRLRVYIWIEDLSANQEVWSSGYITLIYHSGYNETWDTTINKCFNVTLQPNITWNTLHKYRLNIKFDMDCVAGLDAAYEFDCAGKHMVDDHLTRIELLEFKIVKQDT